MPAEAHYCPGNPECTLIDEYGRHLRGEAALRVIDFGPVPTLFPGIVLQPSEKHDLVARNLTQAFVRECYSSEMIRYGYTSLHNWQHVKTPLFNGLFSAVLVQGYMGPFFCESQVNRDLLENEYPYTAAHELAHLAGVTSEAEELIGQETVICLYAEGYAPVHPDVPAARRAGRHCGLYHAC